jgi:hypothetical protein
LILEEGYRRHLDLLGHHGLLKIGVRRPQRFVLILVVHELKERLRALNWLLGSQVAQVLLSRLASVPRAVVACYRERLLPLLAPEVGRQIPAELQEWIWLLRLVVDFDLVLLVERVLLLPHGRAKSRRPRGEEAVEEPVPVKRLGELAGVGVVVLSGRALKRLDQLLPRALLLYRLSAIAVVQIGVQNRAKGILHRGHRRLLLVDLLPEFGDEARSVSSSQLVLIDGESLEDSFVDRLNVELEPVDFADHLATVQVPDSHQVAPVGRE